MKIVTIPKPIILTATTGEPVTGPDGKPSTLTLSKFLLSLIADPVFCGQRTGYSAAKYAANARDRFASLAALKDGTEASIPAEYVASCVDVIATPTTPFSPQFAHCLVPLMDAVIYATNPEAESRPECAPEPED